MYNLIKKSLTAISLIIAMTVSAQTVPLQLVNNSDFADNEIYVAIIGMQNGQWIYYDLADNTTANAAVKPLNTSANTLHRQPNDWGYANVFTTLDHVKEQTIHIAHTNACRLFFGFRSPMYLHAFDAGYAGADFQNPTDPNHGLRWELVEFTYDQYDVMFINTTRVDAFQYPMGVELFGTSQSNNAYMKRGELLSYNDIINRWNQQNGNSPFSACYQESVTTDALGGIIIQPSKVATVKNNGYFDNYINQIWSYFATHELYADMGQRGKWRGTVQGNTFVLTSGGQTAYVNKPSTTDVIEGAGTFATGSDIDKAVQAQFCGAMNRGMVDVNTTNGQLQDWGDRTSFFTRNTWNPYVAFFHQDDLSHEGYTYAFAYDDTFDQSSTCATKYPDRAVVTIGGFAPKQSTGINTHHPSSNTQHQSPNTQHPSPNTQLYNLAGQRVSNSYHGLVIQNGKTILKK